MQLFSKYKITIDFWLIFSSFLLWTREHTVWSSLYLFNSSLKKAVTYPFPSYQFEFYFLVGYESCQVCQVRSVMHCFVRRIHVGMDCNSNNRIPGLVIMGVGYHSMHVRKETVVQGWANIFWNNFVFQHNGESSPRG